jgi:DNA-binding CsgD family transcriptional regulator
LEFSPIACGWDGRQGDDFLNDVDVSTGETSKLSLSRSLMKWTDFLPDSKWLTIATLLGLSGRESQILRCIFDDEPEAVIANHLDISPHTVHTHLERLYRKLGVNSRCQATVRVFAEYVRLESRQSH